MMNPRKSKRFITVLFTSMVMTACLLAVAQSETTPDQEDLSTLTDLGLLPGYTISNAHALNDEGHVALNLELEKPIRAFLWRDGELSNLGTLGGPESFVRELNNVDQVVGWSLTEDGKLHAFLWEDGTMQDLGTLGGDESEAASINASGQVVGWSLIGTDERHAFLWEEGTMTDLGTLGGVSSSANSINDIGQIAGEFVDTEGNRHAFLWEDGAMQDLGTLPGFDEGIGRRINNLGQVTGWAVKENPEGPRHVVLWDGDAVTDLGTLGGEEFGGDNGIAFSINDGGLIVGRSNNLFFELQRAFVYYNGEIIDLNTLDGLPAGWYLYEGADINNRGQIAGHGLYRGQVRAFLLTLPASMTGGEDQTGGGN